MIDYAFIEKFNWIQKYFICGTFVDINTTITMIKIETFMWSFTDKLTTGLSALFLQNHKHEKFISILDMHHVDWFYLIFSFCFWRNANFSEYMQRNTNLETKKS